MTKPLLELKEQLTKLKIKHVLTEIDCPYITMILDGIDSIDKFCDWLNEFSDDMLNKLANASLTFGITVRKRIDLRMNEAREVTLTRLSAAMSGWTYEELEGEIDVIHEQYDMQDAELAATQAAENEAYEEMLKKLKVDKIKAQVDKRLEEDRGVDWRILQSERSA